MHTNNHIACLPLIAIRIASHHDVTRHSCDGEVVRSSAALVSPALTSAQPYPLPLVELVVAALVITSFCEALPPWGAIVRQAVRPRRRVLLVLGDAPHTCRARSIGLIDDRAPPPLLAAGGRLTINRLIARRAAPRSADDLTTIPGP